MLGKSIFGLRIKNYQLVSKLKDRRSLGGHKIVEKSMLKTYQNWLREAGDKIQWQNEQRLDLE